MLFRIAAYCGSFVTGEDNGWNAFDTVLLVSAVWFTIFAVFPDDGCGGCVLYFGVARAQ